MLKVEERSVSCTCHWSAKGEPWEIATAAAAAKTAKPAPADGTLPPPVKYKWVHQYSVEAWQQAIYAAWRTAGLSGLEAAPDGSGPVMPCPRCKQRLKLTEGAVCCPPPCGWKASGEPWDIAQAGAAAKVSAPTPTPQNHPKPPETGADAETKPFPFHAMPETLRKMALAVQEQSRAPGDLCAASSIGILSACIGAGIRVVSGPDMTVRPNVFVLTVARSGTGKSAAFSSLARHAEARQAEAVKRWRKQQGPPTKGKPETPPPPAPVWNAGNTTSEALVQRLGSAPGEAACILSPDARCEIENVLGRYQGKQGGTDEGAYLKAWSGEPIIHSRKTSADVSCGNPCLSICWSVQPDVWERLVSKPAMVESGFLARALCVRCGNDFDKRQGVPVPPAIRGAWECLVDACFDLRSAGGDEPEVRFVKDAWERLDALRVEMIGFNEASTNTSLDPFAARVAENAMRLALVFHVARHGARAGDLPVSVMDAAGGIEVARWFFGRTLEMLAPAFAVKAEGRKDDLASILQRKGGEVTLREMRKNHGFQEAEILALAKSFPSDFEIRRERRDGMDTGRTPETVRLVSM
jgi:hypothetical protein